MTRYSPNGELEPAFGNNGILISRPFGPSEDYAAAALAYAHGRVVITGRARGRILLARYLPSGEPDPSFGEGGFVWPRVTDAIFGEEGTSVAGYPGGRILVGTGSDDGAALLRYEPDGSPDSSFGSDGAVRVPNLQRIVALAVGRGGGIVVAGFSVEPCTAWLMRFNRYGSVDRAFGGESGAVKIESESGPCEGRNLHLVVRRNGRFLLAGHAGRKVLDEYSANCQLYPAFAKATKTIRRFLKSIGAMALDSHGRVLLGGRRDNRLALVRLTPAGFIDRRFGRRGLTLTGVDRASGVSQLVVEANGEIVAAGSAYACIRGCSHSRPMVARFMASGKLDRRFGNHGMWTNPEQNAEPASMLS